VRCEEGLRTQMGSNEREQDISIRREDAPVMTGWKRGISTTKRRIKEVKRDPATGRAEVRYFSRDMRREKGITIAHYEDIKKERKRTKQGKKKPPEERLHARLSLSSWGRASGPGLKREYFFYIHFLTERRGGGRRGGGEKARSQQKTNLPALII